MNAVHNHFKKPYADKLAHTYSIVARDPETGEMGVAVQSHWFSVGRIVIWAEAGVGAIATQAFVNCNLGQHGLELLKKGIIGPDVLKQVMDQDAGRHVRQFGIVDMNGNADAWTGNDCIPEAGHIVGDNFSVQANMMLNNTIWSAMAEAFETSKGHLSERMLIALEAAQNAGGDIRGKQSAALLVVKAMPTGKLWKDRSIDLRVEDHSDPVVELRRLLTLSKAYEHMNAGDLAIEQKNIELAMKEYRSAQMIVPDNLEMKYWHAFSLANTGNVDDAIPIFKSVFAQDKNWNKLTRSLKEIGMLQVSDKEFENII